MNKIFLHKNQINCLNIIKAQKPKTTTTKTEEEEKNNSSTLATQQMLMSKN